MNKVLVLVAFLGMLGLIHQSQAASENSSQGAKAGKTEPVTQESSIGNEIQTQEQNKVMNQGGNSQIQTQEQNTVQPQNNANGKSNNEKASSNQGNEEKFSGSNVLSKQKQSEVAGAVQEMLQLAEGKPDNLGERIRTIAQNQKQNQIKLEQKVEKIQARSKLAKLFIGPNYKAINKAQEILEQNDRQIQELSQTLGQSLDESEQKQLAKEIKILEENNSELNSFLKNAQEGFSFFGWFNKLIS